MAEQEKINESKKKGVALFREREKELDKIREKRSKAKRVILAAEFDKLSADLEEQRIIDKYDKYPELKQSLYLG